MALSTGTIPSGYSNSMDVGIGSRTYVFAEFNSFFGDCRKSAYGCTEEMTLTKTVRRRMDSLAVNEITDLANLVDRKKVGQDL